MRYTFITLVFLTLFQPVVHLKTQSPSLGKKSFVILITSYNNEPYCEKNLKSVYKQDYPSDKCRIVYLDDHSTDNTYNLVQKYVAQYGQKFHTDIRRNPVRMGSMLSRYRAAHECDDDEIIIYLDGDDFFPPNPNILSYLNALYQTSDTWMTYGSFRYWCNNCLETKTTPYTIYTTQCRHSLKNRYIAQIPKEIFELNQVRPYGRCYDHLSTYYAWLFKQIKLKDLVYHGWQYLISSDLAIIIPMLEMASMHAKAVHEILYLYNKHNPLNCHKQYKGQNLGEHIRTQRPYQAITKPIKANTKSSNVVTIGIFTLPSDYSSMIKSLATKSHTHILLATENMRSQIPANLDKWVEQLETTGAYAAYPLINAATLSHTNNLGPVVPFHKQFAAWQYIYNLKLTNLAENTHMILLRSADLIKLTKNNQSKATFFRATMHAACTEACENQLAIFDAQV